MSVRTYHFGVGVSTVFVGVGWNITTAAWLGAMLRVSTSSLGTFEQIAPPFNLCVPSVAQNVTRAIELATAAGSAGNAEAVA